MSEVNHRFGNADVEIRENELQYLLKVLSNKVEALPLELTPELMKSLVNTERFMVHGNFLQPGTQISPCLTIELSQLIIIFSAMCRYAFKIGQPLISLISRRLQ